MIFGRLFNQSLEHVTFPPDLRSLTLATDYAPSLQGFNQTLEGVTLPSSLESLTLGYHFNQSLQGVVFPEHLESLSFGHLYNQSLEGVRFPESLQTLKFGDSFQHSLKDAGHCWADFRHSRLITNIYSAFILSSSFLGRGNVTDFVLINP